MAPPAIDRKTEPVTVVTAAGKQFRAIDGPVGVVWQGDQNLVRELFEGRFTTIADSVQAGRAMEIKSGPHRSVYRFDLASGRVFLKHCKAANWRPLLRNLFLRSPAEREARAAALVASAGIETTTCAAVGTQRKGPLSGDSFLLTHEISDVRPLEEIAREMFSSAEGAVRRRHNLARALGRLAGRLHRAGLTHGDLHGGNILGEILPNGEFRLALIDVQRVRRHRILTPRRAQADLFGLFNSFNSMTGRSDRRRFFGTYWQEASAAGSCLSTNGVRCAMASHIRQVDAFCFGALLTRQIKNDRKWQRPNRRLIVADRGWQCRRGLRALGEAAVLQILDDPDALFREGRVRFWRRRTANERMAVVDLVIAGKTVACEVRETSRAVGWNDFLSVFQWSPTRRAWEIGHALLRRGLSTVRPILYVESRSFYRVRELLVTERTDGAMNLSIFLAHQLPRLTPAERERWLQVGAFDLAAQLRRLHEFAFIHTLPSTECVAICGQPGSFKIEISNAQNIVRKRRLKRDDVLRTLSRLEESAAGAVGIRCTHRLRFLRCYLGDRFRSDWKSIWSTIGEEARQVRAAAVGQNAPACQTMTRTAIFAMAAALLLAGCNAVDRPVSLPIANSVRGEQLLVLSDVKLDGNHELIRELSMLREQVAGTLALPIKRDTVVVYLFNTESQYRRYMSATFPRLPPRSAYFVGTSTELAVYTHWGNNVRVDLRHEFTHGMLHSAMKRVPLWLDEGLAEYFEVSGPRPGGINGDHAQHLIAALSDGWKPDLKRLEMLDESVEMKQADYQEAWAWVHFLLNSTPEAKDIVLSYLKDLRTTNDPKPISQRLFAAFPDFQEQFVRYASHLPVTAQAANSL